ncbi:MAG: hypothetical protein ISS17_03160 [Bacteroidales bacterium]|nr:hypothetical protein [Bacteroidales bacterium]
MITAIHMKRSLLVLLLLFVSFGIAFAQEPEVEKKEKKPLARAPFESGIFMDDQTVKTYPSNTLEFVLQHRFGTIQNGFTDLFGIWGATNIRMTLNYSITDNLMIGFGTTKDKRYQDLSLKYTFFHQRKGGFPLTIGYYGNVALNAGNKSNFGKDYAFIDRFSYFHEVMIARRFSRAFSMQLGFAFIHYNKVDTTIKNDAFSISAIARLKVSPQTSIVASCEVPLMLGYDTPFILKYQENRDPHYQGIYYGPKSPLPNFGLGVEISTSTHAFHIFISAAQGILPQDIVMYNQNDFFNGAIMFGFNMTRLWNF